MKKNYRFLLAFTVLFSNLLYTSCRYCADNLFYSGNYVENRIFRTITKLDDNPVINKSKYKVLVITDIHCGGTGNNNTWTPLFSYLDSLKGTENYPEFCISLGDSADHGDIPEYEEYTHYLKILENEYSLKTFNAIGNHDCYQSGWDHWNKYCYPFTSYYKFETANFSYYFLDTGTGTLGTTQLQNLKIEMSKDPKYKIVSTHYPLFTNTFLFCTEDTTERNELMDLYARTDVKMVLGGHIHKSELNFFDDYVEFTLPSFRYQQKWGILTVDETTGNVTGELKSK